MKGNFREHTHSNISKIITQHKLFGFHGCSFSMGLMTALLLSQMTAITITVLLKKKKKRQEKFLNNSSLRRTHYKKKLKNLKWSRGQRCFGEQWELHIGAPVKILFWHQTLCFSFRYIKFHILQFSGTISQPAIQPLCVDRIHFVLCLCSKSCWVPLQ